MYLDVKGLITTGVGNLIDPLPAALRLPWKRWDGTPAARSDIEAEWRRLKSQPKLAKMHHKYAGMISSLRLTDADIDALVAAKLASNEVEIKRHFPDWDSFPADAQLAILSLAWACGPSFAPKWPGLSMLIRARNWRAAGTQPVDSDGRIKRAPCDIKSEGNPGVIPRNRLQRAHFVEAASDIARQFPAVLHGPCTLAALNAKWQPL